MHQPEHTPRTLFVDDESINQQIGAEILLALGAEADTADNGLQALRLIRTRHYAIVFTDVEMHVERLAEDGGEAFLEERLFLFR